MSSTDTEPPKTIVAELTLQQRGWYAVNYINQDGYDFLRQFAIDKNSNARKN